MLGRRRWAVLLASLLLAGAGGQFAVADEPPPPPPICDDDGLCSVDDIIPGLPGNPGDPGEGGPVAPGPGGDPCGYTLLSPQPPASDPIWGGNDPAISGQLVYEKVCPGRPPELVVIAPSIGALPAPMDPAELAQLIIASMQLLPPPIETMPPAGSEGAITGVPVWFWVTEGLETTGPQTASDAAGGVAVRVTAQVTEVTWDLGDGTALSCGIGTPYDGTVGPSPTCGHVYEVKSTKSDPNGTYTITATSTWTVAWTGGGESGTEIQQYSSTSTMRVTEINVINVPPGG